MVIFLRASRLRRDEAGNFFHKVFEVERRWNSIETGAGMHFTRRIPFLARIGSGDVLTNAGGDVGAPGGLREDRQRLPRVALHRKFSGELETGWTRFGAAGGISPGLQGLG